MKALPSGHTMGQPVCHFCGRPANDPANPGRRLHLLTIDAGGDERFGFAAYGCVDDCGSQREEWPDYRLLIEAPNLPDPNDPEYGIPRYSWLTQGAR